MKKILLLLAMLPSCLMAQEKIGNKIYKYGDLYHAIEGTTLLSFEKAEAKILGDMVTVLAESVTAPVAVRYASGGDMGLTDLDVNLGNTAGLPASPFTIKSVSEK